MPSQQTWQRTRSLPPLPVQTNSPLLKASQGEDDCVRDGSSNGVDDSSSSSSSRSGSGSMRGDRPGGDATPEEREKATRQRNRDHSRKSRERKKAMMEDLKNKVCCCCWWRWCSWCIRCSCLCCCAVSDGFGNVRVCFLFCFVNSIRLPICVER